MHKLGAAILALFVFLSMAGCRKQEKSAENTGENITAEETAAPSEENTAEAVPTDEAAPTEAPAESTPAPSYPRVDTAGNPIQTKYADGSFVKAEHGSMTIESGGKKRSFKLTARAEKDISALEIGEGQRIIVNFNLLSDGTEEAVSIEKILSEEPGSSIMQ